MDDKVARLMQEFRKALNGSLNKTFGPLTDEVRDRVIDTCKKQIEGFLHGLHRHSAALVEVTVAADPDDPSNAKVTFTAKSERGKRFLRGVMEEMGRPIVAVEVEAEGAA